MATTKQQKQRDELQYKMASQVDELYRKSNEEAWKTENRYYIGEQPGLKITSQPKLYTYNEFMGAVVVAFVATVMVIILSVYGMYNEDRTALAPDLTEIKQTELPTYFRWYSNSKTLVIPSDGGNFNIKIEAGSQSIEITADSLRGGVKTLNELGSVDIPHSGAKQVDSGHEWYQLFK